MVVLFLSFLFLGFMIGKLKLGEPADFAILLVWIGVYLAGGWWLTEWKCPRCGKVFGHRLWTQRCISCDLSKDEVAAVVRGRVKQNSRPRICTDSEILHHRDTSEQNLTMS